MLKIPFSYTGLLKIYSETGTAAITATSQSSLSLSVYIFHASHLWQLAKSNIKENKDLFLIEDIQGEVFFKQRRFVHKGT